VDATDADAIRASLAEPETFAVLFDRHFDAVHAYVQRRLGPTLADEIAAEAFGNGTEAEMSTLVATRSGRPTNRPPCRALRGRRPPSPACGCSAR
jgi:hypothetical protein